MCTSLNQEDHDLIYSFLNMGWRNWFLYEIAKRSICFVYWFFPGKAHGQAVKIFVLRKWKAHEFNNNHSHQHHHHHGHTISNIILIIVVITITSSKVLRQHIAGLAQSEPCTVHTHCTARPRCITLSKIQNNRQFKERLKDYYACALSCRSSLTIFIIAVLYNLRILTQLTPHLPAMSLPSTETFHPSLREGQGMHLIQH